MFERPFAGNIVRAALAKGSEQALVLCHVDTVWPLGELESGLSGSKTAKPSVREFTT